MCSVLSTNVGLYLYFHLVIVLSVSSMTLIVMKKGAFVGKRHSHSRISLKFDLLHLLSSFRIMIDGLTHYQTWSPLSIEISKIL